jgi:hypothetical protein
MSGPILKSIGMFFRTLLFVQSLSSLLESIYPSGIDIYRENNGIHGIYYLYTIKTLLHVCMFQFSRAAL